MRKLFHAVSILILITLISNCAGTYKNEYGKPIDENQIPKIVKGKTTSSEIISWFGAPTTTSTAGEDDLLIYKHCRMESSYVGVGFVGQSGGKEECNELTLVIDKTTGKVKDYSYKKQLKD